MPVGRADGPAESNTAAGHLVPRDAAIAALAGGLARAHGRVDRAAASLDLIARLDALA